MGSISKFQYDQMLARTQAVNMRHVTHGPRVDRESELHYACLDFCRARGWLVIHSRMDCKTTQQKGVSDMIVITPKTVAFVELKARGGKLSLEQHAFAAQVRKLGWPVSVAYNIDDFITFMDRSNEDSA